MLKVGVIGSGWVAKNRHIPSFKRDGRVQIVGLASLAPRSTKDTARKFGISRCYESAEELLKENLDVVDICTPPFTHHELTIKAAEAGCHIFLEKPFAMNSREAQEMIDAARRNDVALCVSHNFLFSRSMSRARELHKANALGEITGAIAFQMSNMKRRLPDWFPRLPGGLFFDESPHMLYSILEFLGDVSVEWSTAEKHNIGRQPLSRVEASMKSNSKAASAYLRFTFNAPRDEWVMIIMGTKGVVLLDFFRDILIKLTEGGSHNPSEVLADSLSFLWQTTRENLRSGLSLLSGQLYFGHDELIRLFIDSVEAGTAPPIPPEQGKKVVELIEQILTDD